MNVETRVETLYEVFSAKNKSTGKTFLTWETANRYAVSKGENYWVMSVYRIYS